jgi:hypothetical protein
VARQFCLVLPVEACGMLNFLVWGHFRADQSCSVHAGTSEQGLVEALD